MLPPLQTKWGAFFLRKKGRLIHQIDNFGTSGIILDGLFGTGFKGMVRDPYASLIEKANGSGLPILAIDIPSGLNGTHRKDRRERHPCCRDHFLRPSKNRFFPGKRMECHREAPRTWISACLKSLSSQAPAEFHLITEKYASSLLPPIQRNRHKYQAGYVIGLAGSLTMPGAGLLSSLAAFRTGSGMVRLLYPSGMEAELSASPYELIKIPYTDDNPEEVLQLMQKASATFVGAWTGTKRTKKTLAEKGHPFS